MQNTINQCAFIRVKTKLYHKPLYFH